jgi:hypothetical protein
MIESIVYEDKKKDDEKGFDWLNWKKFEDALKKGDVKLECNSSFYEKDPNKRWWKTLWEVFWRF